MNIRHIFNTVNSVSNIPDHAQKKENGVLFSEILASREKTAKLVGNNSIEYKRSISFHARVIEQRPSCIICGQTISSEGTCLCEYPTVINYHGNVNLNHNEAARTECYDTSEIPAENTDFQTLSDNMTEQDTEKIKLRHRCPICGTVSDDGSCMCDALNKDKNSDLRSIIKLSIHSVTR